MARSFRTLQTAWCPPVPETKKETKEKRKENSSNKNRGMRRGITQPVPPLCFLSRFIIGRDGGGWISQTIHLLLYIPSVFFFFFFFFGVCSTRQVSGESIMSPATLFALHLLLLLAPHISPVPFSSFFHVQPKYLRGYFTHTQKWKEKKKRQTQKKREIPSPAVFLDCLGIVFRCRAQQRRNSNLIAFNAFPLVI